MLSDAEISAIANYIRSTSRGLAVDALSRWLDHERREGIDSDWLAAHDAEVARKTLEDAADEISTRWERMGSEAQDFIDAVIELVRARAGSISTDKAGDSTSVVEALSKATGLPTTRIHTDRHPLDMD